MVLEDIVIRIILLQHETGISIKKKLCKVKTERRAVTLKLKIAYQQLLKTHFYLSVELVWCN